MEPIQQSREMYRRLRDGWGELDTVRHPLPGQHRDVWYAWFWVRMARRNLRRPEPHRREKGRRAAHEARAFLRSAFGIEPWTGTVYEWGRR